MANTINTILTQWQDLLQKAYDNSKVLTAAAMMTALGATTDLQAQQWFSTMVVSPDGNTLNTATRDVANGTNINTVDGPKSFANRSSWGSIFVYDSNTGKLYEPNNGSGTRWALEQEPDEAIGNGTASYKLPIEKIHYTTFRNQTNPSELITLNLTNKRDVGTVNGVAATSPVELLKQEYILEWLNSLPDGRAVYIGSRAGSVNPGGSRDGIGAGMKKIGWSWVTQTTDPRWYTLNTQWPTLGTEDISSEMKVTLYPNPTSDYLTIDLPDTISQAHYETYDVTGRMVDHGTASHQEQLDVTKLNPGTYIIQLTDKNDNTQTTIEKFIVK